MEQATEGSMRKSVVFLLMRKTILFWSSLPVLSGSASLRKALTADEQTFIEKAATSEQTEIRLSQLAVERASSPEVKQFAQSMVTDQSASLLKPIAADDTVALPENLGPEINEKFKRLKKTIGNRLRQNLHGTASKATG